MSGTVSSILTVGGFLIAMSGTAMNLLGMALMWFAPVQSLAFRSRFKLNLVGAALLFGGVAAMAVGAIVGFLAIRPLP